jgi:hypothetical protein
LARFARRPPDLELTVRLSAKGQDAQVELNTKDGQSPLAANVKAKDGAVTVDLGSVTVQMRPSDAARPDSSGGSIREVSSSSSTRRRGSWSRPTRSTRERGCSGGTSG